MRPRETDWAYLAGLIDGEGHVAIVHGAHNLNGQARVVIAMSTEQPLKWLWETFKVGCYSGPREVKANGRIETRYRWGTYSTEVVQVILERTLPYLKLKREKAEEVIRYCEAKQLQTQDVAALS